jgi:uncharacterized coiled-coil protein SlyX
MDNKDDRIEKAEVNIVYLQETVQELNEIVTAQEILVSKLERQVEFLAKRVEELDTEARPNRKPPHY